MKVTKDYLKQIILEELSEADEFSKLQGRFDRQEPVQQNTDDTLSDKYYQILKFDKTNREHIDSEERFYKMLETDGENDAVRNLLAELPSAFLDNENLFEAILNAIIGYQPQTRD